MADTPPATPAPAAPGVNPTPVKIGGESLVDRVLPHMKKILITLAVVTVVLSVFFTHRWWVERGEQKETLKLAVVLQTAAEPVRGSADAPDPKVPSYADWTERANSILSSAAAQNVDLGPAYRGNLLLDTDKVDEAIATYRTGVGLADPDGVLCREGLGLALEQKATAEKDAAARNKGFEEALATFQSMQADPAGPRYAYAQYHAGRILQQLQKLDEAKAAYLRAKDAAKGSTDVLPELIEKRLASLGAS